MPTFASNLAAWHDPLLSLLPLVRATASAAFRHLHPSGREDAVCDVVADTTAEYSKLAAKGRAHHWFIAPIARYAVRRRSAGRRVGTASNKRDALSPVPRGEAHVTSLDALESSAPDAWRAAVADSRRTDPAEAAAFRVDFAEWFASLTTRQKDLITSLSQGERPGEIAARLGVSPGRVSQLRAELRQSWLRFQGDAEPGLERMLAAA